MKDYQQKILNLFRSVKQVESLVPPVADGQIPPPDPTVMNLLAARAMLAAAMTQMQQGMGEEAQARLFRQPVPIPAPQPATSRSPSPLPAVSPVRPRTGQGSFPLPQPVLPRHLFLPQRQESPQPVAGTAMPFPPGLAQSFPWLVPQPKPEVSRNVLPPVSQPTRQFSGAYPYAPDQFQPQTSMMPMPQMPQRVYGQAAFPMGQQTRYGLPIPIPQGPRVASEFWDERPLPEPGTPGSVISPPGQYNPRNRRRIRGTGPEDDTRGIPVPIGFPGMGGGMAGMGGGLGGESSKLLKAIEELTAAVKENTSKSQGGGRSWDKIDAERNTRPPLVNRG